MKTKRILAVLLTVLMIFSTSASFAAKNGLTEEEAAKLFDAITMVEKEYPFELKEGQLYDGLMKGLFQSLDDYSDYYNKEDAVEQYKLMTGEFQGIGVTIKDKDGYLEVVKVHENSPAEKSKLMVGDLIIEVDGKDIKGQKREDSVAMIKGKEGTKVKIKILRGDKKIDFELTRATVTINPVSYKVLEGNIGYIELTDFTLNAYVKMKEALKAFDEKNVSKIILDLRDNPGGVLNISLSIAELFVPKGKLLSVRTSKGIEEVHESQLENQKYKLVVLINGNSASASEIVAGAVKDRKAGVLVGEKTFGKGVIQRLVPLKDGTLLKYTYAEYMTPNGTAINKKGIEPDYVVKNEVKDGKTVNDLQLKKAIELLK